MNTKYRKKPVVINAIKWTGKNWKSVAAFAGTSVAISCADGGVFIPTLEGQMRADIGDWIIRGVKGELYPCKPDIFAATYDKV